MFLELNTIRQHQIASYSPAMLVCEDAKALNERLSWAQPENFIGKRGNYDSDKGFSEEDFI